MLNMLKTRTLPGGLSPFGNIARSLLTPQSPMGTPVGTPGPLPRGPAPDDIEGFIRQVVTELGGDPEVALRVARSEGGLMDPTRQSDVVTRGRREPSFGPFQLLVGGGSTGFPEGLGNRALALGIDPRDPKQWQAATRFALETAQREGWGAWYGAKNQGITGRMGWGGVPGPASAAVGPAIAAGGTPAPVASSGVPGAPPAGPVQSAAERLGITGGSEGPKYAQLPGIEPVEFADTPADNSRREALLSKVVEGINSGSTIGLRRLKPSDRLEAFRRLAAGASNA